MVLAFFCVLLLCLVSYLVNICVFLLFHSRVLLSLCVYFMSLFVVIKWCAVCLNFAHLVGICVVSGILKLRGLKEKEEFLFFFLVSFP